MVQIHPGAPSGRLDESGLCHSPSRQVKRTSPKGFRRFKSFTGYHAEETYEEVIHVELFPRLVVPKGRCSSFDFPLDAALVADGRLEVLSGNHRVKASIEAGLDRILVLVIPYECKPGRKIAIQLSHNALSEQDDVPLLKELWDEIDELNEKLYSGLDSVAVQELAKVNFSGFGAQVIRTEQVTLFFIPEEVAEFDKLLDAFDKLATSQTIYLAPLSHYDKLFELIVAKKKAGNIKNTSVALMALIDSLVKANDGTPNTSAEQPAK